MNYQRIYELIIEHNKKRTTETKEKIKQSRLDTSLSQEIKDKISLSGTGKFKSEETKFKMRKPKSEEHKANISKNHWRNKGKHI